MAGWVQVRDLNGNYGFVDASGVLFNDGRVELALGGRRVTLASDKDGGKRGFGDGTYEYVSVPSSRSEGMRNARTQYVPQLLNAAFVLDVV
jgi:hypothetical protein